MTRLPWPALAALLSGLALTARGLTPSRIDWQPGLVLAEPWRAFSAAALHYSDLHLAANLAGCLLVGALGWVAQLPLRSALAWFIAWPLTQLGLLLQPELRHFGGMSGVLHAGVLVVAVHLLWHRRGRPRWVGAALAAGVCIKVLGEAPWGPPLRQVPGWDIALAPVAHASGALAGALCALVAEALASRSLPHRQA